MGQIAAFVEPYLGDPNLRRITLSGGDEPVRKAVLRPVEVRGARMLQLVTYDAKRSTTANVESGAADEVQDVLRLPFRHVVVDMSGEIVEGRVTKKGKLLTSRTKVDERPVVVAHDRVKAQPVPQDAAFLDELGIAVNGSVRAGAQAKYRQINEFVRLLDGRLPEAPLPLRVVDLGCGNAYLTFAVVHHVRENLGRECTVLGVDRNHELICRNNERAERLGWAGALRFEVGDLESFDPPASERPSIVIALHACDTGSDLALAAAVRWQSDLALVAPCCHHHVQAQLRPSAVDAAEASLLRHGILRERLGDVLTDSARAAIMRMLGYDVDAVEFVSPEHTPKNLLIRASNRMLPVPASLVRSYEAFVGRWSIRPLLADLLRDELAAARCRGPDQLPQSPAS